MPHFTIHDLYTSMSGNAGPLDYRNKGSREDWTAWDWLCALKDGLTGVQAGNNRSRFDKLKADLYELFMAKGLISNMTEADMMTRYGRKLRSLGVDLGEAMNAMQDSFSEGEWTLINDARPVFSETDSLDAIEQAENHDLAERFQQAANRYCEQLFAERRRIERTEPDSEERRRKLMDLTSQIYVADYMAKNAEQRIPLGFPRVFSAEDVRILSGNMLKDTVYRAAVRTEVVNHPVPVNEGDELNPQDLIGTMTANIENAAPDTMVTYDPGTPVLQPADAAVRLALLRDVKRQLDATGTGYTWFFYSKRDQNSPQYEDVRREIQRQIDRIESGLPVGPRDDQAMIQVLNAYTAGREKPFYNFAVTRQNNMLRLYSEYTMRPAGVPDAGYPTKQSIEQRYNTARGKEDPLAEGHIRLEDHSFDAEMLTNSAVSRYQAAVTDLRLQLQLHEMQQRPFTAQEQMEVRQTILRLTALQDIMTRDRAGKNAAVTEAMLAARMAEIERGNHYFVDKVVNAALRDNHTLREIVETYEHADLAALSTRYFEDRAHFTDPLQAQLDPLTYPMVAQRLVSSENELQSLQLPEAGALSAAQQQSLERLGRDIITLRILRSQPGKGAAMHVSLDALRKESDSILGPTRFHEALARCGQDTALAIQFKAALLDHTLSPADLVERIDRFANGPIDRMRSEALDEFRQMRVPADNPQLTDEQKALLRDKLVRMAALENLKYARAQRFPDREFLSDELYTSEEIAAAEEDVRQNQPAFLQSIEPHLSTAQSAKDFAEKLASSRYQDVAEESQRIADAVSAARDILRGEQLNEFANQLKERAQAALALHELQKNKGSLSAPVTDEELRTQIEATKLSDGYLAVERLLTPPDADKIQRVQQILQKPDTLDESLRELAATVAAPKPARGTIGEEYSNMIHAMQKTVNPTSQEGRSMISYNALRAIALRQQILQAEDGQYAPANDAQTTGIMADLLATYPLLTHRIAEDMQVAMDVANTVMNEANLYQLKVDQRRALARGEEFADPLLGTVVGLTDLRYQQIFDLGMQEFMKLQDEIRPGYPLTGQQKTKLLNAVTLMILSREGEGDVKLPEARRLQRLSEMRSGENEFSRDIIAAVDRVALDGSNLNDIFDAITVSREQLGPSLHAFQSQLPAAWADSAWKSLENMANAPHPNSIISNEEREHMLQAYVRMLIMRQASRDPEQAQRPVSLAELNRKAEEYLAAGDNRVRAELALHDPMAYLLTGTIAKKIANVASTELAGVSPEYAVRFKLLRVMALRNLEKKFAPEAGVTENQIEQEERAVRNSMAYRILSDPNYVGAIDFAALVGENYDTALENALYASPARKPVLLGDVAENSFEGKRILFADELRHDRVIGAGPEAEHRHFAELYALSLYNDGTWKGDALPGPDAFNAQVQLIMSLPDFQAAMRRIDQSPEQRTLLLTEMTNGAPAERITAELNSLSNLQRRIERPNDLRRSDLHYDIRSTIVQKNLNRLRETDAIKKWSTEAEAADPKIKGFKMTREEARTLYVDFLASNLLYMRNPGRCFFSDAEMAAARTEVEQDAGIQSDLQTVLSSPQAMRFNIFNLAPAQYWTEIRAMEDGRDIFLNGPGGDSTKVAGLNLILFSLVPVAEARINGRDISGKIVSNDDLNIERNRIAFTEEFISLENALRHDINELDRIKSVLKLPADQFQQAFKKLTDEYKQKYPEADILNKDTIGGDYLKAKEQVRALENADFANDEAARKQLAHSIREIMTIRNVILTSKYDVSLKRNTVEESDQRNRRSIDAAIAAGKHHLDMRLGTPEQLEERLKDPQIAAQFIDIMKGAEDLRRLYGKKLASGREIVDPLEQQMLDRGLDASVLSHAERQTSLLNRIRPDMPSETADQKNIRLKMQIAALFNLVLHSASTDPKNMPSEAVLAEQSQKITTVPDFGFAVDRLSKDPQQLAAFLNNARNGMTPLQMAAELNRLSAEEQRALNPEADPHPDILFRLRLNVLNEANEGMMRSTSSAKNVWSSNAERDTALNNFMHYTAVNRLMAQHPGQIYFTEQEVRDSFLQAMNDRQLQQEYAKAAAGGPIALRKELFSFGGRAFITALNTIEDNVREMSRLDVDDTTYEGFQKGSLYQIGVLLWLQKDKRLENNHYTTTAETEKAADDFFETDTFKTLETAAKLDPREMGRYLARVLPLSGDAFLQGVDRLAQEYRSPLNLTERSELNRILISDLADSLLSNKAHRRHVVNNVKKYLADTLNIALRRDLPPEEQPNAEEFLRQRETILAMPEYKYAASWLADHPQELKQISEGLKNGMTPAELVTRLDEASIRQQTAEKVPHPSSHLGGSLQYKPKQKEPQNQINIINEPPRKAAAPAKPKLKLKPLIAVVPDLKYKSVPAMQQFQRSAALLERTLNSQQANKISAKEEQFVKAAHQGILKTLAYRKLAERDEYAQKEVGKDALNAEMERLEKDKDLAGLTQLIENNKLGTVLEGIKKLENDSEAMEQFLKDACIDPDKAIEAVNSEHPAPAPKFVTFPPMPATKDVKRDGVPTLAEIDRIDADPTSPLGRYKTELNKLNAENINNRNLIKEYVTNLYALRQIIAVSEDPAKPDKYLETDLGNKAKLLENDTAFKTVLEPCGVKRLSAAYIKRMKNIFNEELSFNKLTDILQHDGEKYYRYKIRPENEAIKKENDKILSDAEKDLQKAAVRKP